MLPLEPRGRPDPARRAARYLIELTPAFHTFRVGHCIRLLLAGSEFPSYPPGRQSGSSCPASALAVRARMKSRSEVRFR